MKKWILFVGSALLSAQTNDSLMITASRAIALQPDEMVFAVIMNTPLATNLDDAVAALAGSGITAADLSGVSSTQIPNPDNLQSCVPGLQWTFTIGVPLSKAKDTTTLLESVRQNLPTKIPGAAMNFAVQGLRVSQHLRDSQECPTADLVADARAKAEKLASAARALVGPIVSISDGTASAPGRYVSVGVPTSFPLSPQFPANTCAGGTFSVTGTSFAFVPACTIEVSFSLIPAQ